VPDISLLAALDIRCTNCGPAWPDYVGAIVGLLGAGLAGIALRLTHKSSEAAELSREAAERSAKAAEDELALFREEVAAARTDRARRAAFDISLTAHAAGTSDRDPPMTITIAFGVQNTGDRPAHRLAVNIVVPEALHLVADREIDGIGQADNHDLGRGREACVFWSAVLPSLDPEIHYVPSHVIVEHPPKGTYPIYVELMHEDLPGRARAEMWQLVIPPSGSEVSLIRTSPDAPLWRPAERRASQS
jgi:hypothetical protein